MLDFTCASYLGLRHPSHSLTPWPALTTGAPAALVEPSAAAVVARELASLIGCETALLGPSTLHLFWDLFGLLARERIVIHMDLGLYPIARWGIERAAGLGVAVRPFEHYDIDALRLSLWRTRDRKRRPVVVTDGFCPRCGRLAPVAGLLESTRAFGGLLVLDDSQALGIFGESPGLRAPYGRGGGGTPRRAAIGGPDVVVVSSLAKGFGAPLAVITGGGALLRRFGRDSETRVHCSPPSLAAIHAAARALRCNRDDGDLRRLRLAGLVQRLRRGLRRIGLAADGGLFPVQTLALPPSIDAATLHARLLRRGVRGLLHETRSPGQPSLSFVITAAQDPRNIARAVERLAQAIAGGDRAGRTEGVAPLD